MKILAAVGRALWSYPFEGGLVGEPDARIALASTDIQDICFHPVARVAYVASSDCFRSPSKGFHVVSALSLSSDGQARPVGAEIRLEHRPVSLATDASGRRLVIAFPDPPCLAVHPIGADGSVGPALATAAGLPPSIYPHHVQVLPSDRTVLVPARGRPGEGGSTGRRGALLSFSFEDGVLSLRQSVDPTARPSFGPRQAALHPNGRWLYVVLERENELHMYRKDENDHFRAEPDFVVSTLAAADLVRAGQAAGAIRIAPDGRFVYVGNRGDGTTVCGGRRVFSGGENTIAVFGIDPQTGAPSLIQSAETRSVHVRTFSLDASGRHLVAGSIAAIDVEAEGRVIRIPAKLTAFSIGRDGMATATDEKAVDTSDGMLFWCGIWDR